MDGHRTRRTKDPARKHWYAFSRQVRFARWLGSLDMPDDLIQAFERTANSRPTRRLRIPEIAAAGSQ
jgi:hypothetical protein